MRRNQESIERDAEDEKVAAERALAYVTNSPLCPFCNADLHCKPDCPVEKVQKQLERELRQKWDKFNEKQYGYRRRKA